jgi:hypothetical protein
MCCVTTCFVWSKFVYYIKGNDFWRKQKTGRFCRPAFNYAITVKHYASAANF